MIPLEDFVTLKKLTVGNVRVAPMSVRADYIIEKYSGETLRSELIYSYEKEYFDPRNPADINLASMMTAQAALNYGLFFEEIKFEGVFDGTDRKFIHDMIENTSREIITNKLLVKNEFLVPPFDRLEIDKKDRYTMSRIVFGPDEIGGMTERNPMPVFDAGKYVILSSGGKDSLLSYGLTKEFGDVTPVFINESGRHWFTAVNAYRHLREIEPNTEKPWCNSDRVFNMILRHLPFIRKDYASLRADMYPVRLWTVAVFLFGALPVALRTGAGNILIGDEYDTTVIGTRGGISHYSGLYDQSRFFDNMMTRYYRRKGWEMNQYSLLRSMSELLIMRTLLKRYPELQSHQVSCHAAVSRAGRVYPCGKCEKCRRITGMITALDDDPGRCGYSPEQVKNGLDALEKSSVKQIGSDASHLYYLLLSKGLIARNAHTAGMAKPHPEILKLRFDNSRSMLEDLPVYVRKPLFEILMKVADGAVVKTKEGWKEIVVDEKFLEGPVYKAGER